MRLKSFSIEIQISKNIFDHIFGKYFIIEFFDKQIHPKGISASKDAAQDTAQTKYISSNPTVHPSSLDSTKCISVNGEAISPLSGVGIKEP